MPWRLGKWITADDFGEISAVLGVIDSDLGSPATSSSQTDRYGLAKFSRASGTSSFAIQHATLNGTEFGQSSKKPPEKGSPHSTT